jgi:hypothetical protein
MLATADITYAHPLNDAFAVNLSAGRLFYVEDYAEGMTPQRAMLRGPLPERIGKSLML